MKRDKFKKAQGKVQEQVNAYRESRNYKLSDFATYFEVGDGMEQFLWKAGKEGGNRYVLDIIPFEVMANLPWKARGNPPDVGDVWFNVDVHVHSNVGPNNEKVVCPKHSFKSGIAKGKKAGCPICEDIAVLQENLQDDPEKRKGIWRELKASRRNLYNVVVRDGGEEEDKGVQVFDVAHFYFQGNIEEALDEDDDDGVSTYWDIDEGKQISFKVVDQGEGIPPKFTAFKLKNRVDSTTKKPYVISDEELEASVSPQKWLKLYSYDEIYELYHQKSNGVKEEPEDDDDDEPVRKPKGRREKVVEEDVSDLPSKTETKEVAEDECPNGFVFGQDFSAKGHEEVCDDCDEDKYELCRLAAVAIRKKGKKGKKTTKQYDDDIPY